MTDNQAGLDALQRLPETASLEEITEELRIMASVRRGRADIAAGCIKTQEEAERLLECWIHSAVPCFVLEGCRADRAVLRSQMPVERVARL
jgi:hypothetical protein